MELEIKNQIRSFHSCPQRKEYVNAVKHHPVLVPRKNESDDGVRSARKNRITQLT